jgi:hypothetical protein
VLSKILNVSEETIRITDLKFFTEERVIDDLFESERRQFMFNTWRDYAQDGMAMQFNVEVICPHRCYDAACDGTDCDFKPYCYDPACDRTNCEFKHILPVRPHGIDGTQCDCSDCTFDYGFCSCGCAGDHRVHAEWLEEREAFVHETVNPPPTTPEIEEEDDNKSETSVESAEEKESRMWSDFKLAMMAAFTALLLGVYLCRTVVC